MKIKSLSEIVSCNECGKLVHIIAAQEVQVIHTGNAGGREHYCKKHRKHYYMRTTTSGYQRFYRQEGKEIVLIAGGWFDKNVPVGSAIRAGPHLPL